jgi:hypothetical protein
VKPKKTGPPPLVEREVRHPWERQEQEGPTLFKIFSAYLTASPRSVRKAIGTIRGRTPRFRPGHISRAAVRWRWRERAAKYDEHLAMQDRVAFESRRRKAREDRLSRLEALSVQVWDAVPKMRLSTAEPAVIVRALEVLAREERTELLDEPEDRRSDPDRRAALPDLDQVLRDSPSPEPRPPAPQKEGIQ